MVKIFGMKITKKRIFSTIVSLAITLAITLILVYTNPSYTNPSTTAVVKEEGIQIDEFRICLKWGQYAAPDIYVYNSSKGCKQIQIIPTDCRQNMVAGSTYSLDTSQGSYKIEILDYERDKYTEIEITNLNKKEWRFNI